MFRRFAPSRQWLRFGLRGMLALTVLAASVLAWKFNGIRARQRAVAAILNTSATKYSCVAYDYEEPAEESGIPPGPPVSPFWIDLLGIDAFADVDFVIVIGSPEQTDPLAALVPQFTRVRTVLFMSLSDQGLGSLAGATSVESLTVTGYFHDAAVLKLKACRTLKYLGLHAPNVTQAAVDELQRALPDCKIEYVNHSLEPNNP